MKILKNKALLILAICILSIGVVTITYRLFQDENKLTLTEKRYLSNAKSNLININILNDTNIFGKKGTGVFYDILDSFEKDRELTFNKVTISKDSTPTGLSLTKGSSFTKNDKLIYTDHFVLVSKTFSNISSIYDINSTIGVLNRDVSVINKHIGNVSLTIKNYSTSTELEEGLKSDEVGYILVPRIEYLDFILDNLYSIVYHFGDIKDYYYMMPSSDETLNSILKKSINIWKNNEMEESLYSNEYNAFTSHLKITEKELDVINSKEYSYGFIKNAPYDIKSSGTYGGIINEYLESFSKFSDITFKYKEYRNLSRLYSDIKKNNINLVMDYYGLDTKYAKIDSSYTIDISFVMSNKDVRVYNSISSLDEAVYVKKDTLIEKHLKNLGIDTLNYTDMSDLKSIFKAGHIVAMDRMEYLLYKTNYASINERFRISTTKSYNFLSNNDTMFNRLFTYYINYLDKQSILYSGLENYNGTIKSGRLVSSITKYALIIILSVTIAAYITYKFGKKIHIKKRIKKADKMKYIDMLTSLKNRNFLSENISKWNQNTIYPQAVIVVDLNGIQFINDTYGYQEGDKQIQALANILIKTQLDNTEIIRTDGNEFTIYMIGYNEKQVLSYIKKINKEFKNLPYDKGAAIGFSMIEDDLKLIDDAINEATEIMKKNKGIANGDIEDEKI